MLVFYSILLILMCAVSLGMAMRTVPPRYWLLHPAFAFGWINVLTLGIRGIAQDQKWIEGMAKPEVHAQVLLYNIGFFFLYFAALHLYWRVRRPRPTPSDFALKRSERSSIFFCQWTWLGLVTMAFLAGSSLGIFHSLGQEAKSRDLGLVDTIIRSVFETRWFLVGLSMVTIRRYPKTAWAILAAVGLFESLQTIAHGGRGHVFLAFKVLCAAVLYQSSLQVKVPKVVARGLKFGLPTAAAAFILITAVTALRQDRAYDDNTGSISDVTVTINRFMDDGSERLADTVEAMVVRLSYPYDNHALILMAEKYGVRRHDYPTGSWPDAFKFVPRFLWRDKPLSTFNYYMSEYLLGRKGANTFDLPVGRVSEADYAFGPFGVLLGAVYGLVFAWLFCELMVTNRRMVWQIVYVMVYFAYMMQGAACMTNRMPIIMQSLVLVAPALFLLWRVKVNRLPIPKGGTLPAMMTPPTVGRPPGTPILQRHPH